MAVATGKARGQKVQLPRFLHLTCIFGVRFPVCSAVLITIEMAGAFTLLFYTELLSVPVLASAILMCGSVLFLFLYTSVSIWSSGVLDDVVDYVGESNSRPFFSQANLEAWVSVVPAILTGALPAACYLLEIRDRMEAMGKVEFRTISVVLGVTSAAGPFLSLGVVAGPGFVVRLVAALLKSCVHKHFDILETALSCEGLPPEERIQKLDGHCKTVKRVFEKANECITFPIFTTVVLGYLAALVMCLQLVVFWQQANHSLFMLICLGGMSVTFAIMSTLSLHSMTSVADHYEDVASDLTYNLKLRFKITNAFPGPPGVKLLNSFESDHVNDLSFNLHHRPLDARTLEGTLIRLFVGAVTTVVIGILF